MYYYDNRRNSILVWAFACILSAQGIDGGSGRTTYATSVMNSTNCRHSPLGGRLWCMVAGKRSCHSNEATGLNATLGHVYKRCV